MALAVGGVLTVAAVIALIVILTGSPRSTPSSAQRSGATPDAGTPASAGTPRGNATSASTGGAPGSALQSWDGGAAAQAPATTPDGVDDAGNHTTYVAANMLDENPATAWRMDGNGTGALLSFTLDQPRSITELALINGYAKSDPATRADRYAQERRILAVSWFLGGRVYQQRLTDGIQEWQGIRIPASRTGTVELRIDAVTQPGDSNFDYTAISDVLIAGG